MSKDLNSSAAWVTQNRKAAMTSGPSVPGSSLVRGSPNLLDGVRN
jgi:hypothetical protein